LSDGRLQVSGPDGVDLLTGIEALQIGADTYGIPAGVTFTLVKGSPVPPGDVLPGGISDNGKVLSFTELNPDYTSQTAFLWSHGQPHEIASNAAGHFLAAGPVSGNGRFVTYWDDDGTTTDNFILDSKTGDLTNITEGANGVTVLTSLSDDGRFAALYGDGSNLMPDADSGLWDVMIYDRASGKFENITKGEDHDSFSPTLSGDGKTVAFESFATNLVPGESDSFTRDVFVFDRTTGKMDNITHGGNGASGSAVLSEHGNVVAFQSDATNLVAGETDSNNNTDIFIFNQKTGTMDNITHGANGASFGASISDDGRYVTFSSNATNLVPGDADLNGSTFDVFVYDTHTGKMANLTSGANGDSFGAAISGDGSTVEFATYATNLAPGSQSGFANTVVADVENHLFA
jgi:tricorn protease-like protein